MGLLETSSVHGSGFLFTEWLRGIWANAKLHSERAALDRLPEGAEKVTKTLELDQCEAEWSKKPRTPDAATHTTNPATAVIVTIAATVTIAAVSTATSATQVRQPSSTTDFYLQ